MIAFLASAFTAAAAGEEDAAAWWLGLPVSDVQLSAASGGLPPESLEALLRTQQAADRGEPLDPQLVRLDLATLFQVGTFSAVEAHVEPWVAAGEDGVLRPAVLLTFVVWPAPRIRRVRVEGQDDFSKAELLDALELSRGQTFYADPDARFAEERVESALHDAGYPEGSATVESTVTDEGLVDVTAHVVEGEPRIAERVVFAGELEGVVPVGRLRRWARRAGVAEGRPLPPTAREEAVLEIRTKLGRMTGPRSRWIEARVEALVAPIGDASTESAAVQVTITVEPGPQLEIEHAGLPWPGRYRQVVTALAIDHRTRLTRGFLDRAPERMESVLQERGWLGAAVDATLEHPDPEHEVLVVKVDRGPKYTMTRRRFRQREKVHFDFVDAGLTNKEAKQLTNELELVLDQASPDLLRREIYTRAEMERVLDAVRLFLADRGHLDAQLTLLDPVFVERGGIREGAIRVVPQVAVVRGPVTRLVGIEVEGNAEGLLPTLASSRRELTGEPFSPRRIEELAARIVEAHRAHGYLEADARVTHVDEQPGQRTAVIVVEPGPQVLLRSVVVTGARRTKTSFIQNVADDTVTLGQPVNSEQMDELRDDLYDLGVFRVVSLDLTPKNEPARDLVVQVIERGRYELEGKFGVSTDQGIRLSGRATRYHLWGLAHRFDLLGQIGFDWATEDIANWLPDFSDPEWRLAATYTAPRFPLAGQTFVVDVVLREVEQERTWKMDRTGAGIAIVTQIGLTELRVGPRVELRRLDEVDTAVLLEGEPWAALVGLDDPTLPSPWRIQDSLVAQLVHDFRDDRIAPRRGALVSSTLEWAPGLPWDEVLDQPRTAFLKGEARASLYVPVERVTLHLGLAGGYVGSTNEYLVPLEDRFRLGGTNSLRGYVRDGVGPHNSAERVEVAWPSALGPVVDYTLADDPNRWAPTGGDLQASGIAQLIVPLTAFGLVGWDSTSASVFADAGNVWFLDPTAVPTTDLTTFANVLPDVRLGVGAGFQMLTPIGPLSLDVAVNPQVLAATGGQELLLKEELEEPPVRAHLTLGATF